MDEQSGIIDLERLPTVPIGWLLLLLALVVGCDRAEDKKPALSPPSSSSTGTVGQPEPPRADVPDATIYRIRFADRSADSGIEVRYNDGREDEVYSIIESLGGGLAAFDYDCDGHPDLAYAEGGRFRAEEKEVVGLPGWLYQGLGDWRFRPVLPQSRLDLSRHYHHGLHVADFDNDGFPDLLVTGYGGLQLWHNLGDGTFQEVAREVGLIDPNWSSTAAWGDLEGDGDLDLLVAHYADWSFDNNPPCVVRGVRDVCGPRDFRGVDHLFFRNLGDGRFEPMPKGFLAPGGRGLGVLASDLDGDGDTDWYVANDEEANYLYRNEGDGRLTEIGLRSGTALDDAGTPDGSMGVGVGDYNNDGKFDLFVTHYETETCALYSQSSRLNFLHMSRRTNVTAMGSLFVGWGVVFNDYDLDGDEDLVTVNGHAVRQSQLAPVDQLPVLLENLEGKSFRMAGEQAGSFFQKPASARGLAVVDFNHDGKMDLATSTVLQDVAIVENQSESEGAWLKVQLVGTRSNRDGIGATLRLQGRERVIHRNVYGGGSYASTSERLVHFGMARSQLQDGRFPALTVRWPSGTTSTHELLEADRLIRLVEPTEAN